jgi:hypothetical protein
MNGMTAVSHPHHETHLIPGDALGPMNPWLKTPAYTKLDFHG